MKDSISDSLKQFIERERYKYPFELTGDTELERDLMITGDDAVDFILAFGKAFDVDVSHFPLDEYFSGEGLDFVGFVINIFRKEKKQKKVLRLIDLQNAISSKSL